MLGGPRCGSKAWEALDRAISEPGENRGQIVTNWESQPAAGFHGRENRRNLGPAYGLPMCIQFLRPRAAGRIEFSARLLLKRLSWQLRVTETSHF